MLYTSYNYISSSDNSLLQVGHAGTLDPMATGLLIVCVGKSTKLVDRLVHKQGASVSKHCDVCG